MGLFKPSIGIIFYNMVKWKRLGLWSRKDMVSFTQSTNKAQKNKKLKLKKRRFGKLLSVRKWDLIEENDCSLEVLCGSVWNMDQQAEEVGEQMRHCLVLSRMTR